MLAGIALVIIGIIIIIVEQFVGYGKHGSYGALPIMLGFLLILVSSFSFVKAVAVKIALAFLPNKLMEKIMKKEEEAAEEEFHDLRDIHNRKENKGNPNKSAKSVVTRNR